MHNVFSTVGCWWLLKRLVYLTILGIEKVCVCVCVSDDRAASRLASTNKISESRTRGSEHCGAWRGEETPWQWGRHWELHGPVQLLPASSVHCSHQRCWGSYLRPVSTPYHSSAAVLLAPVCWFRWSQHRPSQYLDPSAGTWFLHRSTVLP